MLDNDQDFHLALESCRRLGAGRMVEYLEAAAAFFPKKRVPVIDQGPIRRRQAALAKGA